MGIDNPHSADPAYALSPYIAGTTGWRIWKMLSDRTACTWHDYMGAFQRANVCDLPILEGSGGRVVIPTKLLKVLQLSSSVVLLGDRVRKHFGLPKQLIHPIIRDGVTYRQVPHPSGRCRFYNCPTQRELVAMLLEELYAQGRKF
jgi:hypothetical protein